MRGVRPPVGVKSTTVSAPVSAAMAKTAMLSCPRLEAYRKRPSRVACRSAMLLPSTGCGSDEIVWACVSTPRAESQAYVETVELSSLVTYSQRPLG